MIYSTSAHANGGRQGTTSLDDGSLSLALATPGTADLGHNPEQLFAMGYAACFDNAVKLTAKRLKLPLESSETHVTVGLKKDGEKYKLDVKIDVTVTGLEQAQKEELLKAAHQVCPYSNALRGDADVHLST